MKEKKAEELAALIITKAKELGADLAGIARVEDLKKSPSHRISERMPDFANVGAKEVAGRRPGQVDWPEGAQSAIVIAIEHPEDKPELDWWILGSKSVAGNTPGNKLLQRIDDSQVGTDTKQNTGRTEIRRNLGCGHDRSMGKNAQPSIPPPSP